VFRETFGTFMRSATLARCHARPRGFAEDFETAALFHRNQAAGDDWTGPLIDRWFLDRPLARSRRGAAARVADWLQQAAFSHGPGLRVTSLASGCAAELFAFFERQPQAAVSVRCVDLDSQALLHAAQRAEAAGLGGRMAFVLGPALPAEDEPAAPHPQHRVYALGLCEYLGDEQVVALLNHVHQTLAPGGEVLLGNLASGQPDRLLMQHLLDWPARHRTPDELLALWERSAFAAQPLSIELDSAGVSLFLRGFRGA
jgi:extracellular factor (EF) 3-hydroxypalmitic acid methyl ester biosynthesis protein